MTDIAKYLVFAITALSIGFLGWSIGLLNNQAPWEAQIKDELAPRIKGLVEGRDRADARWYAATTTRNAQETDLPIRRAWYARQLKIATTGQDETGKTVTPAVIRAEVGSNGLVNIVPDANRQAIVYQIDGAPALSFAGFKAAIEKQLTEIRETRIKVTKTQQDTTTLTTEISGTKPAAEAITNVEKGLRGQLMDADTLRNNAKMEQDFLQSPITNDMVELDLLKRRQLALESRLKELAKIVLGP
jgi:hypothetical protein